MEQIVERLEGPGRYAVLMYAVCERLRQIMLSNPLTQNHPDLELIVDAWQGAQSNLLQRALAREEYTDPGALSRFLLRWNLQALGVAPALVDAAAAALEQAIAQDQGESQTIAEDLA